MYCNGIRKLLTQHILWLIVLNAHARYYERDYGDEDDYDDEYADMEPEEEYHDRAWPRSFDGTLVPSHEMIEGLRRRQMLDLQQYEYGPVRMSKINLI